MKFDSPIFDRIRVKPDQDRRVRDDVPACDWPGCGQAGAHRAPKGRNREREYWHYCLDHVREYNQSYNFFAGMSDDAVRQYQKDALTGHRPTWKMGLNGKHGTDDAVQGDIAGAADPFGMFSEMNGAKRWSAADAAQKTRVEAERRTVFNAERKALDVMGLEAGVSVADIKARFKLLVKQHHPDANGGDRSSEDRLRDIIQAYKYLKSNRFD